MKILAIGAHPDDIELGVGGTIVKEVKEGHEVYFLIITNGESGGRDKETGKREAKESAKLLGVKRVIFLDVPDTKVKHSVDIIKKMEKVITDLEIEKVYTHAERDTHQDHRNTALCTLSASRKVPFILAYESPTNLPEFTPLMFVDIGETIDLKIQSLQLYRSQGEKEFIKIDAVKGLAKFRGLQAKLKYAESFNIIREIVK